jgi:2'-5' RNA ligase
MPRLFVAIDLPPVVKQELTGICSGLLNARWVKEGQIHLTLRFIGEVEDNVFQEIKERFSEIKSPSFLIRLAGVGCFSSRSQPRIVWAGVDPVESLVALHNQVELALVELGFVSEGQKFSPHVTIARLRNTSTERVARYLAANTSFVSPNFAVNMFHLYSSVLTGNGALHQIEASYPLILPRIVT